VQHEGAARGEECDSFSREHSPYAQPLTCWGGTKYTAVEGSNFSLVLNTIAKTDCAGGTCYYMRSLTRSGSSQPVPDVYIETCDCVKPESPTSCEAYLAQAKAAAAQNSNSGSKLLDSRCCQTDL
jgi:hypothetical protein